MMTVEEAPTRLRKMAGEAVADGHRQFVPTIPPDPGGLLGTQPAAGADCGGEPRAVPQHLTGRRGRGHLRGPLLCERSYRLPPRSGDPDNGSDGCRHVA